MKHIPNILSVFRIVLIPWFVWEMYEENTISAAVILGVSGLTDLFDGMLARRFGWVSQLGKVLDPVADKLTQVTVCIVLAIKIPNLWPFFCILLGKELVMLVLGGFLVQRGIKLEGAKWFGKVVTVLFYTTTVLIVFIPDMPSGLKVALLSIVTFCALAAAFMYIPEFRRYKKRLK